MGEPLTNGQLASYLQGKFEGLMELQRQQVNQLTAISLSLGAKVDKDFCIREHATIEKKLENITTATWSNRMKIAGWSSVIILVIGLSFVVARQLILR